MSSYLESLFSLEGKTAVVTYVTFYKSPLTKQKNIKCHERLMLNYAPLSRGYRGGTRGIGQSIAVALAKAGADIILVQVHRFSSHPLITKITFHH